MRLLFTLVCNFMIFHLLHPCNFSKFVLAITLLTHLHKILAIANYRNLLNYITSYFFLSDPAELYPINIGVFETNSASELYTPVSNGHARNETDPGLLSMM